MLSKRIEKVTGFVTRVLIVFGVTALTIMMFLTAADIAGRFFFNRPISGALELVEYLMAIIVPTSIAYCALKKEHVAVELIFDLLPKRLQKFIHFLVTIPSIAFILLIAWQNYLYVIETYDSNLTSAVLEIPSYPFVIPIALGTTVFAIILFLQLFEAKSKEHSNGTN